MSPARLAITTSRDRIEVLSRLVLDAGLEPVALPCIEVSYADQETLDGARTAADAAEWVIVTSARAVDALWPHGDMPVAAIAAVGDSTAAAIAEAGGRVEVVGTAGAADLLDRIDGMVAGTTVFFPHAAGAGDETVERLQRLGARLTAMPVYATRAAPPGDEQVDAALFGSPSAVAGWAGARTLGGLVLAAIGVTTASALSALGHPPSVVPDRPDYAQAVEDIVRLLERSPV